MTIINRTKNLKDYAAKAATLASFFEDQKDDLHGNKAEMLAKKLFNEEYILAFSGHFSAGKSTMINTLIEDSILPTSPIPTSANVVKIHAAEDGREYAKVYTKEKAAFILEAPYELATLKHYAKNGESIHMIEIAHQTTQLPKGVTVMDTPGIDSTDDAHRLSTESSLHLADLVFFVMDYNHVQSELNFQFTRELQDKGVQVYLIVNQIDKHQDSEISFPDFKKSVVDSFKSWGVKPKEVFFTSLREPIIKENDFHFIQKLIKYSIDNRNDSMKLSSEQALNLLIEEYSRTFYEKKIESLLPLEMETSEFEELLLLQEKILKHLDHSNLANWSDSVKTELSSLLKNVQIMPFETREKAEKYLSTLDPSFKVGGLFSKSKTLKEKEERLSMLLQSVQENSKTQIDWHIRPFLNRKLKESGISDEEQYKEAEQFKTEITEMTIEGAVSKGSTVNSSSLLNYSKKLTDSVVYSAKQNTFTWIEKLLESQSNKAESDQILWNQELKVVQGKIALYNQYKRASELADQLKLKLKMMINSESEQHDRDRLDDLIEKWKKEEQNIKVASPILKDPIKEDLQDLEIEIDNNDQKIKTDPSNVVKILENMSDQLTIIPGFSKYSKVLKQKAARLNNQHFTISLFGAFSAGKSSFANALLEADLLPVSPNPTTASITQIKPIADGFIHGEAQIFLKNKEELFEDVKQAFNEIGIQVSTLDEASNQVPFLTKEVNESGGEIHVAFLKAFHEGYSFYNEEELIKKVSHDEFRLYVAEEKKACFVREIYLYADSGISKKGITLVDTPGADSINARHTGVAFEYIKNSDAILFVTYYNHAFSKADREFLIQLGRVKDAFELDKMYFIVNAIDLAQSKEESSEVLQYVQAQLQQYGIRFPNLYGVSSLMSRENDFKLNDGKDGMKKFKDHFYSFLETDLKEIAIQSAKQEWEKGLLRFRHFIDQAKDMQNKSDEINQQINEKQIVLDAWFKVDRKSGILSQLEREMSELIFYIHQRVFLRYSTFFKESFHPGKFTLKNHKQALYQALDELRRSLGFDLAQELRATSLRMEKWIHRALIEAEIQYQYQLIEIEKDLVFSNFEPTSVNTPHFKEAFDQMDDRSFDSILSIFKNAKSFFEKNDKQKMQDELEKRFKEEADTYLAEEKGRLLNFLEDLLNEQFHELLSNLEDNVNEQFTSWRFALDSTDKVPEWEKIYLTLLDDGVDRS
jgi:small GTP-binding protein